MTAPLRSRSRLPGDPEAGSATLEFIGLSVVLLVPIVLAIAALSLVQRASYAASGAARDAARMYATAPDVAAAGERARAAAEVILRDYDLAGHGDVLIDCQGVCLAPGTSVRATVTVTAPLPGLGAVFGDHALTHVTITSSQVSPVDQFRTSP